MKEIWKPVVGANGKYEISNLGRVKSLHATGRPAKHGLLSLQHNKKGYLRAALTIGNRRFTKVVHRLVLEAFIGPQPSAIHESNHKDGRKNNNQVSNLEWVTPVQNNVHSVAHGFWHPHIGEDHGRAKLTKAKVRQIRCQEGLASAGFLARKHGVSPTAIRLIWKRINWKHVT